MDIKQLRALQAIAESGSFSEAAQRLGITQSALSHQIRNLEEDLEETLVIRARPKVYPSPAGAILLKSAERIFAELDELHSRFLKAKTGPVSGMLRVAASNMSIVYLLGDLFEAFIARYPEIELVIRATETAEEAVRRVLVGTADLAFSPLGAEHPQLSQLILGSTEHAFVVARSHELAAHRVVNLEQLRNYPFVAFTPGSGTRSISDDLFMPTGGYPAMQTESNDAQFIKRIISLGKSVALMPVCVLAEEVRSKRLALLQYEEGPLAVDIGLVQKRSIKMNAIDLFKAACLDARGPGLARIGIQNSAEPMFDVNALRR